MNVQIEAIVKEFAKANKFSSVKAMNLAMAVMEAAPKRKEGGGKPLGEESKRVRQALQELAQNEKGQYTSLQLAERLNTTPLCVNSNLHALAGKGMFKIVGDAPKQAGKRGRAAKIWQAV